jgi:hypothetical protein
VSTQTFTSSSTWTAPAGVTSVSVAAIGGGAGGGGGSSDNVATSGGGGGGGGGAAANGTVTVIPGNVYTVTVGAGGAGGAGANAGGGAASNGGAGGDTWFDTSGTVLAKGGSAGGGGNGSGISAAAGGQASASIGSTTYSGGNGGSDSAVNPFSGSGGGSSAGTSVAGNNGANAALNSSAAGGAAPSGGGAGGNGENKSGTAGTNGQAAGAPGGGGGGAGAGASTSGSGGAGAAGQIILTWTAAPTVLPRPNLVVHVPEEDTPEVRNIVPMLVPQLAAPFVSFVVVNLAPKVIAAPEDDHPDAFIKMISPLLVGPPTFFLQPMRVVFQETPDDVLYPVHQNPIQIAPHPIDYTARYAAARGNYRIANPACFRFFRSSTGPPNPVSAGGTPFATSATLPYQPTNTYADGTWYLSVSYFDGFLDSGFLPIGPQGQTYLTMTLSGGMLVAAPPSAPTNYSVKQFAGGVIKIMAIYLPFVDGTNAATQWAIAYTTDGSTPANNSPSITQAMTGGAMQVLSYSLPTQAAGTTVKVQLQVRRAVGAGWAYSAPLPVLASVVPATAPASPQVLESWPGQLPGGG